MPSPLNDKPFYAGPGSRLSDLWFAWRVFLQFVRGFRALHFSGSCVTVFGSARFPEGHPYYVLGQKVGAAIARMGFTVLTGGGPGIMEAANRGAKDAGGLSIGCNIRLPVEQSANPYLDRFITLEHFFVRKVLLVKYSYAFVILPGGFGTMDEFFEVLTLVQTAKIQDFPVIVMGREYYQKLQELVAHMLSAGTIQADDMRYVFYTDSVEEMAAYIESIVPKFGITTRPSPSRILREHGLRPQPSMQSKTGTRR